jgi:hypothetical protein
MNQPMPVSQQPRSGGALKWVLLGCGGLVFLAVAFFAVAGYLVARNFSTDPAKAEATAQEIVTFEKPDGFKGAFSMSVMGLKMVMLAKGDPKASEGSMIMLGSFPIGQQNQEQYQTQINESMKQQGHGQDVTEQRAPETFKVRGKDVVAQVVVAGPAKLLRYTLNFDGGNGRMITISVQGPEKTTDHAWVQKFLDTVK